MLAIHKCKFIIHIHRFVIHICKYAKFVNYICLRHVSHIMAHAKNMLSAFVQCNIIISHIKKTKN